ncbi:MAG: hypothetical protein MI810_08155 [Flavobacteriales bacterium]|nr:hypothetical protein [Flavobacteriales bacterium]
MSALRILKKGLRPTALRNRIVGFLFIVIPSLILYVIWTEGDSDFPMASLISGTVFSGALMAAGVVMIITSFDYLFKKHPILVAIEEQHFDFVVWIYPFTGKKGVSSVYAYTAEGKLINIYRKASQQSTLIEYLRQHFPWATVGFKEEYKKILKHNPKELLKIKS